MRKIFVEALAAEDATRLRFLDETSIQIDFARSYGRAPGGARCPDAVPDTRGTNVTVVATLSANGMEAVMEQDLRIRGKTRSERQKSDPGGTTIW